MSRIVDRDRGRSVLMSGIVWCYLESLVTTSGCKRHSREFLWAIRDRGRNDADCYKNVAQPGWQEASLWINDFYRVTIPGTICDKRKQSGLSTEVKIYLEYLLRVQRPASEYLFDTFCPDYCGDNLSCDRQYLETLLGCQPHTSDWSSWSQERELCCQQTMGAELRGNWPHRIHTSNKHTFRQMTLI